MGTIQLAGRDRILMRVANAFHLSGQTGIAVLKDGTSMGPLTWAAVEQKVSRAQDRCGPHERFEFNGAIGAGLKLQVVWSVYEETPVIAVEAEIANASDQDAHLDRLILFRGLPPAEGFAPDFPRWPECRFLYQPHYWASPPEKPSGACQIPAGKTETTHWSTVVGAASGPALAIGIGERARAVAEICFRAEEGRVGLELANRLRTDRQQVRPLRLPAGARWTAHRMLLVPGADPNDALDRYTAFVCKFLDWRLRFPPYTGLFTAYGSDPENQDPLKVPLSEKRIGDLMAVVEKHLKPYGLDTIKTQFHGLSSSKPDGKPVPQLTAEQAADPQAVERLVSSIRDKGFAPDDYDSRQDFPHGLGWHVRELARSGYRPALVCRPFYNIKAGTPALDQAAVALFEMAVKDWGYQYLMFDFNSSDYESDNDTLTIEEGIYNRFKAVRDRLGPEIFMEACMVWPGPVLGVADGFRPAMDWRGGNEERLAPFFAARYHYHGRFFQCDSEFLDPAMRPFTWARGGAQQMASTLDRLRLWVSYIGILGYSHLGGAGLDRVEEDRWRVFQRAIPSETGRATAVDLLENVPPRRWVRKGATPSGEFHVLALFNWDKQAPMDAPIDPKAWGLPDADYLFFDFWAQEVVGPARRLPNWTAPFSCRIVRATALPAQPALVGHTRHVCGQAGVEEWHWNAAERTLRGVFTGAPGSSERCWIWLPGNEGVARCAGGEIEYVRPWLRRLSVSFPPSGRRDWELLLDPSIPVP